VARSSLIFHTCHSVSLAASVLHLEAGQTNRKSITRKQVSFSDVLPVDKRAVSGLKVSDHEGAIDLTDLTVDAAGPAIIETDIGIGTSTKNGR
jgi:hypothetical protein